MNFAPDFDIDKNLPEQNQAEKLPDINLVLTNGGLVDPFEIGISVLTPYTTSVIVADKYIRAANIISEKFGPDSPHVSLSVLGGRMVDPSVMYEVVEGQGYALNPTSFDMPDIKTWYHTLKSLMQTPLNKAAPRAWATHMAWHQLCVSNQIEQIEGLSAAATFWQKYKENITNHKVGIRFYSGQIVNQPQLIEDAIMAMNGNGLMDQFYVSVEIDANLHGPYEWLRLVRNLNANFSKRGVQFTASADLGHLNYAFRTHQLSGTMYEFLIQSMGYPDNVFSGIELHAHDDGPNAHESIQKLDSEGLVSVFHAWGSQVTRFQMQHELGIPSEAILEDVWPNSDFVTTDDGVRWLKNNVVTPFRAGVKTAF